MDPSANKSADQTDSKKDPNMDKFFENINGLSNRSRIELARSCGKKIVTRERSATASIVAQAAFYQCLPTSVERWKEGRYAFCGCISAFIGGSRKGAPLPKALGSYVRNESPGSAEAIKKRLIYTLNKKWDDDDTVLPTQIYQFIHFLHSKGYETDVQDLLESLLRWNSDSKYIQLKWLRTYLNRLSES